LHSSPKTTDLTPDMRSAEAVFIIGAGHFGMRAAELLSAADKGPIFAVDVDEAQLSTLQALPLRTIAGDGIRFLCDAFPELHPRSTIVPAVPLHLAYEWLKRTLEGDRLVRKLDIPKGLVPLLPHTWPADDGSLLVSFADYVCPDDCPEPAYCTVTGERRDPPLYGLLRSLEVPGFRVHVIRSYQLAPGLGGYRVETLQATMHTLTKKAAGKWLLCTSCRCHGVVTALDIAR